LLAAGLLRPLDVQDAAVDVPDLQGVAADGLPDVLVEPVLPSGDLQVGGQDLVVSDDGNLLGLRHVQAEPSVGGDHLQLPRVELLPESEPPVLLVEPSQAVVLHGLDETLPVFGDPVDLPSLNYHGPVPSIAVDHDGLQPFAMLSSLQSPALNLQCSNWSKLFVTKPHNIFSGATLSLAKPVWTTTSMCRVLHHLLRRHEILRRRRLRTNINLCVKFMLEFTGLTRNVTILRENRYLIHPCW
jgi:hypothetical protein